MAESDDEDFADQGSKDFNGSLKFLLQKCRNITKPLSISFLNAQYQALGGTNVEDFCWHRKHRKDLHELKKVSRETRAQMHFILSIPVNMDFLRKLRKKAEVELDDSFRIIRYSKWRGGIDFAGAHIPNKFLESHQRKLRKLLVEMAKKTDSPIVDSEFLARLPCYSKSALLTVKQRFFESSVSDDETKLKVLFWWKVSLHPYVLESIRQNAQVKIGKNRNILKYRSNHLELNGICWYSTKNPDQMWKRIEEGVERDIPELEENVQSIRFEREMAELIKFVIVITERSVIPMGLDRLCIAYNRNTFNKEEKIERFDLLAIRLLYMASIDMKLRIKIMFICSLSLRDSRLEMLRRDAIVEVNEERQIIKYQANDGSLKLEDTTAQLMDEDEFSDSDESEESDSEEEDEDPEPFIEEEPRVEEMMDDSSEATNRTVDVKPIIQRPGASHPIQPVNSHPEAAASSSSESNKENVPISTGISMKNEPQPTNSGSEPPGATRNERLTINIPTAVVKENIEILNGMKRKSAETDSNSTQKRPRRVEQSGGDTDAVVNSMEEEEDDPDGMESEEVTQDGGIGQNGEENLNTSQQSDPNVSSQEALTTPINGPIRARSSQIGNESTDRSENLAPSLNSRSTIQTPARYIAPNVANESTVLAHQDTMSSQISTEGSNMISPKKHRKFLKNIKRLINSLEIPVQETILIRIDDKIKELESLESGNRELDDTHLEDIKCAFESCIMAVSKASKVSLLENSVSLREFLLYLKDTVQSVELPALDASLDLLTKFLRKDSMQLSRVPLERAESALETILNIVAP